MGRPDVFPATIRTAMARAYKAGYKTGKTPLLLMEAALTLTIGDISGETGNGVCGLIGSGAGFIAAKLLYAEFAERKNKEIGKEWT
jgi:hypothetical protein